ncbi:hypothetical protein [Microbacterium resistens]|uniref:hypothetical protein n=1 Tax=Microbacterium resistens TaxID=156977 RepID=UPI00083384F5|nr:hypothetical protein [Microbacterium resistens]
MRRLSLLVPLALAAVLLAGCAPSAAGPTPSTSPTTGTGADPSPAPTPEETPETSALVLSLDTLSAVSADGAVLTSAPLSDAAAVTSVLTDHLGEPTATTRDDRYGFTSTKWGEAVIVGTADQSSDASVSFRAAEIDALALRSSDGASVGMTGDEVAATGASLDSTWSDDANGRNHEVFVSQRKAIDGTSSLVHPGETGSVFVSYDVVNSVLESISAPGNDFSDL